MERVQKLQQLYQSASAQKLKSSCKNKFVNQKQQQVHQQDPHLFQMGVRPECPLTMEKINRKDLYVADCLHCFNKESIREWVEEKKNLTCPICRKETVGFKVDNKFYLGNRHINYFYGKKSILGGWVATTARVGKEVFIDRGAKVFDHARVIGTSMIQHNAKVYGFARVRGTGRVMENAQVFENATITGTSQIMDDSKVYGNSFVDSAGLFDHVEVFDNATVESGSEIQGHAKVYGNARVSNQCIVKDNAKVYGDASINLKSIIKDNAKIGGNTTIVGELEIGGNLNISQELELKHKNKNRLKINTNPQFRQAVEALKA